MVGTMRMHAVMGGVLVALLLSAPGAAQIVSPAPAKVRCGEPIPKDDVLVLDLEPFEDDEAATDAFVSAHVRDLEIRSWKPETIRTRVRSDRKDRMSAMKRAQKTSAKRGCNVVLVLSAWEGYDEGAFAPPLPGAAGSAAMGTHYAYAEVLLATGDHLGQSP